MSVEMYYPTDSPNFSRVCLPTISIYFSYRTPIAFKRPEDTDWTVRQNEWGSMTGKHLNYIDTGTGERLPGPEFERLLALATEGPFEVPEKP